MSRKGQQKPKAAPTPSGNDRFATHKWIRDNIPAIRGAAAREGAKQGRNYFPALLAFVLWDMANAGTGLVYNATVKGLAKELECDVKTVRHAIEVLIECTIIAPVKGADDGKDLRGVYKFTHVPK